MSRTALEHVVARNENAKAIRRYAFAVSLSALSAIVRSSRAGGALSGFTEVAMQMRRWSRDLEEAVQGVAALTAAQVRTVSDCIRATRLLALLHQAAERAQDAAIVHERHAQESRHLEALRGTLRRTGQQLDEALDGIAQLGLMATVLSRAALIEASGSGQLQHELTVASQEFATYAARVNDTITETRRTGAPAP